MKQVNLEFLKRFAFIPIVLVVVLLIILAISGERIAPTSTLLLPIITMIFLTAPCMTVVYLAARSFLATGSWQAMLFGGALLSYGVGNSIAPWIHGPNGPNITITMGNVSNLLASFFIITLAALFSRKLSACQDSKRKICLVAEYAGVLIFISLLSVLSIEGLTPAFYVSGTGPTILRQLVLWSAAILFGLSSIYILWIYSRVRSNFLYWSSLGLGLITTGFIANTFLSVFGDAINWLGRIGQYLGSVYLALAIVALIRETRRIQMPLDQALADFFNQAKVNYQLLVGTIADAVVSLDAWERILTWNWAAETIFGYTGSEAIGSVFVKLLIPRNYSTDFKNKIDNLTSLTDRETPGKMETVARRKNGEEFPIELSLATSKPGLERFTTILVIRDITERKQAEEALKQYTSDIEAANKELESFSYSVSHDLRAPLRTLDGFSEMVIEEYGDKLDETGKDYLNRIRKASQTMSQLIDDILKLSRITRADIYKDKIEISNLVKSIADEIKAAQPERQAEIVVQPGVIARGDRHLLEIALRNLMENSWKFTGKCPLARIEFGVTRQDGKLVFFVKDNGVGFDMKYADKLFQPFRRLHSDKEFPGTGIGLATVQRVIRRHGGSIWAESEIGRGATFYFTLE